MGRYRVCTPSVASEVIDGEAIIMDLRSGSYYSADGVGALIWSAIEQGAGHDQIVAWIAASYPAEAGAGAAADAFIGDLVSRNLIEPQPGADGPAPAPAAIAYSAPALSAHEDMQDLIMLDPIHDVGEMGWPTRKVETAGE